MIQLAFIRGSGLRKVIIKGREIAFILPELNNVPLVLNLDKLEEHKEDIKQMKIDKETLDELMQLVTEEDLANDIMKDLKRTGWRVLKKDGNS